ncbi:hypothetical protein HDF16_001917 [Granulicella aggregans]|uniref:Uncharacterized protein n=1 Tax=Granulicella aggregans TaxID=474949 RepID=A0A7W7ZCD9_9BACT|nr:hypothetical protein [Granulicella aggregans]MBB5057232.1 hypothetical protein [Granulicella aggregans]
MASVNAAAIRAADTLLRGVGGRQVLLRTPAPAIPNDDGEQLGLSTPQFQDFPITPVIYRRIRPRLPSSVAATQSPAPQYELLISATAVNALIGSQEYNSAAKLFNTACGILIDGVLLNIESANYSELGGAAYLYRLLLRAPQALRT